jgi:hypothetical protein
MRFIQKFSLLFSVLLGSLALSGCALDTETNTDEVASLGESESALCKNALSSAEERTALKLIDDICGDTWCEGDYNFAFEKLTCRAGNPGVAGSGSCALRLALIPYEDNPPRFVRSCTTRGFSGFASLVQTAPNGYQSLQPDFYDALSECINELEDSLR